MSQWILAARGFGQNYLHIPLLTPAPEAVAVAWRGVAEANHGYAGCTVHEDPPGVVITVHRSVASLDKVLATLRAAGLDVSLP